MSTFNFIEIDNNIYELSLWDDTVINGKPAEKKKCIIASNTMSSPAKAFNITLNKKTNGEKTLNFSICAKYYDQEIEDFVTNPYLSLLTNERKVKLRKKEKGEVKWYDFIIKQAAEDSSNQTYTYTAKDQHIQELAKSGFELEFDKELQNNTGTKEELAERILKGTGWGVNKEELLEYTKEPVYRAFLQYNNGEKKIQLDSLRPPTEETETDKNRWPSIELTNQDCVYILYSESNSEADKIQVLFYKDYVFDEKTGEFVFSPVLNDENILLRDKYRNYWVSKTNIATKTLQPGIQGERLVQSQKMVYDKALEQYVKIYKDSQGKEVHGFTRTEYNTPELVENLITNGEGDFIDTSGWYNTDTGTRSLVFQPDVQEWTDKVEPESFIEAKQEPGLSGLWSIVNTGLFDNRTKLQGFSKDQPYFFEWEFASIQRWQTEELRQIVICDYEFESGRYKQKEGGEVYFEKTRGVTPLQSPLSLSCKKTVSNEELKKKKIGIFLVFMGNGNEKDPVYVRIKNCKFYRDIGVKPGSISTLDPDDLIKTHYYYYDPDSNYTKFEDIKFLYEGYEEQSAYEPFYEGYEKKRTITGKESNRYNLLQEICEQFECWLRLDIEHDTNGKVLSKAVSFHEYVGKDNRAGFKYGINLKSIKRQIDSNQIVTKMITKDNSNEFAKNGFCSIARAPSNPSGTNVIYNFDYYIDQNLLDAGEVSEALYLTSQGKSEDPQFPESLIESDWKNLTDVTFPKGWGLYPKLDDITTKTQTITEKQIGISKNLTSLRASIDYEQARLDGAESSLVELEEDLENLTGYTYENFLSGITTEDQEERERFDAWALSDKVKEYKVKIRHLRKEVKESKSKLQSQAAVREATGSPYYWVTVYDEDKKELQLGSGNSKKYVTAFQSLSEGVKEIVGLSRFDWYVTTYFGGLNTYKVSNTGNSPFVMVPKGKTLIVISDEANLPKLFEYSEENGPLQNSYQIFKNEYDLNNRKLEYYNTQRKKIEEDFYKRYSRFIQEGSWISEDYIDDELYYLDALATGYTSSRPKVTYTIDVFDLAGVEDYENYEFEIGDKTFVQDQEFFGWIQEEIDDPTIPGKKITVKRPYREEVVVNELTEGIDDITKNTLKVQNYKTQFDDLFQRIAATTESLQYNTGRYERGAKAVEPDGSISHKALQQAVTENGLAIANAGAQTVTIDEQGVVTTDKTLPNKKVRIIGGGIYITKDGGETWETGITGDGINANVITTGQLNTGEINIMTGDAASHRWDDKGITAYRTNYNPETGEILSISPNSFVRLDEFGLYGINSDKEFNARIGTTTTGDEKHGIAKIQRDSLFSLTQDGLTIGKEGYGLKATEKNITIGKTMRITDEKIVIGEQIDEDGKVIKRGGFEVTENELKIAGWTVNENSLAHGDISTNDCLFLAPAGQLKTDISGYNNGASYTIYSKGNFGITTEGKLHAQDAWIGGHIEANTGNIGGIEIVPNGIFSKTMLANWEYSSTSLSASFDETTNTLTLFGASDGEGKLVKAYWANGQESTFLLNCRAPYHWYIVDIFRVAGDYSVFKHGNTSTVQVPVDKHLIIVVDSIDESVLQVRLSSKFSLDSDGYLYAQNADISGTINANNGTIGGIIIKDGGLTSEQNTSQLEEPEKRRHSSQKNSSTSIKISNYNASNARAVRYYKLTGQNAEVKVTLNKHGQNINLVAVVDDIPTGNADNFSCSYAQVLWTGSVLLSVKKDQYILISSDIDDSDSNWGAYEIFTAGFSISSDGSIIANKVSITGVLQAGAGSMFGNFITTESALCFGSNDPSRAKMFISSTGESATIANKPLTNWTIGVGNNFGITSDGNVYATKVYLTGGSSRDEEVYLDYEGVHLTVISTGDTVVVPWGSMG